jgi:Domain of unknown function (DUF6285)
MYDRPTMMELLNAVRNHLETQVIPEIRDDRKLYYQTLVAINVLRIIDREMQTGVEQLREEWMRLNFVQGVDTLLPSESSKAHDALAERNRKLCEEIDGGRYDYLPQRAALYEHLMVTTRQQLEVSNPKFLEALAAEDEQST